MPYPTNRIEFWVDTDSGTYGQLETIKFVIFDTDKEEALIEAFEEGSDSYRMQAAEVWGIDPELPNSWHKA